jgi:starch synthase (maltosyl-transferring)
MMTLLQEKQRVIIANVLPQIQNRSNPAKGTVNEELLISADIFADGNDELSASVLIKHNTERRWIEYMMEFQSNDHWVFNFIPGKTGGYQFKIQAWINHFATWQKGLTKRLNAQQPLEMEMQIGVQLVEQLLQSFSKKESAILKQWCSALANEEQMEKAYELALDEQVTALMLKYRDSSQVRVYPETLEIEVERQKAAFSTWYELFPRSTSKNKELHGTFQDVKNILPRIAAMGFDVLYIPPIHPIGKVNRKGKNNSLQAADDDPGSPWAIGSDEGGHKSIHPQLGTIRDFTSLVKAAQELDIELALDIAFQCAPDHPYVKQHPEWFKWRPDGTVQYAENPPKRYEDILPFNFETEDWQNLWKELKSIIDFWIKNGVSIFRIDNPHTKSFSFWEWLIGSVKKEHPNVIFLAEAFTRPRIMEHLAIIGFSQSYTYFTWRTTKQEIETYMKELINPEMRSYFRPNFWPNTPDILTTELVQGGENMHIIRLLLAATLSSNYGIYGPVYEFAITEALPGKEEYLDNEKYEIKNWDWNLETRITEIITLVNNIRKENIALQTTWNIQFAETSNEKIICYIKADFKTNNYLIIAINLDPHHTQNAIVKIPLKQLGLPPDATYQVKDLLSQDEYEWYGEQNYVQLNPYEMPAHILKLI